MKTLSVLKRTMRETFEEAIANFLRSKLENIFKKLTSPPRVYWRSDEGCMVVDVKEHKDVLVLLGYERDLSLLLEGTGRKIQIKLRGEHFFAFPPQPLNRECTPMIKEEQEKEEAKLIQKVRKVPIWDFHELYKAISQFETECDRDNTLGTGSSSLVRMDNKGIACSSRILLTSGSHPNDWVGTDMKQHHIPQELSRYLHALYTDGKDGKPITITMKAPFFDGRLIEQTLEARIVNYQGDLCRYVRVLKIRSLEG